MKYKAANSVLLLCTWLQPLPHMAVSHINGHRQRSDAAFASCESNTQRVSMVYWLTVHLVGQRMTCSCTRL